MNAKRGSITLPVSLATIVALTLTSSAAFAHPGHGAEGLAAGLAHPLSGADHLLAMVAVGLWAGLRGGRAAWAWPASFVGFMIVGGVLGMTGVSLPYAETGIAASVLCLGLMVGFNAKPSTMIGVILCAAFAVFHGWAHGAEMPAEASGFTFGAGFVIATALLHGAGLLAVRAFGTATRLPFARALGAVVAGGGLALLMG